MFLPDCESVVNGQLSLLEANSEITGSTLSLADSATIFFPFPATKYMLT